MADGELGPVVLMMLGMGALVALALRWVLHRWDGVEKKDRYTICVDFDGVIHSYTTPWTNPWTISDPPVEGAIEWLHKLLHDDFKVVICSARCNSWRGRLAIRAWLKRHAGTIWYDAMGCPGLEEIIVSKAKPGALVYIDDRAHRFRGGQDFGIMDKAWIFDQRPWNREKKPAAPSLPMDLCSDIPDDDQ